MDDAFSFSRYSVNGCIAQRLLGRNSKLHSGRYGCGGRDKRSSLWGGGAIGTRKATTNALGQYSLVKVPKGPAELKVTLDGYATAEQPVVISKNDTINVSLLTEALLLDQQENLFFRYGDDGDIFEVKDHDVLASSFLQVSGQNLFAEIRKMQLIVNGQTAAMGVNEEENGFRYYFPLWPGLNRIQVRAWDAEEHARTTEILHVTWDIQRLDLRVLLDWNTETQLDLHMFKRESNEDNVFLEEDFDRHVFWKNETPEDFGEGDQNPVLDNDGFGGVGPESIILRELTPGDYHIWVHAFELEGKPTTATMKVMFDLTSTSPSEKSFDEIALNVEKEAVYITTLRVSSTGARSFVHVEPVWP